ncbi:hypothetical protein XENOCAPTIV_010108, partial [Xenoophorus captivus]
QGQEAPPLCSSPYHNERLAFLNAMVEDSTCFPKKLPSTSQTLSFSFSRLDFQYTSLSGAMTPCRAFVGE